MKLSEVRAVYTDHLKRRSDAVNWGFPSVGARVWAAFATVGDIPRVIKPNASPRRAVPYRESAVPTVKNQEDQAEQAFWNKHVLQILNDFKSPVVNSQMGLGVYDRTVVPLGQTWTTREGNYVSTALEFRTQGPNDINGRWRLTLRDSVTPQEGTHMVVLRELSSFRQIEIEGERMYIVTNQIRRLITDPEAQERAVQILLMKLSGVQKKGWLQFDGDRQFHDRDMEGLQTVVRVLESLRGNRSGSRLSIVNEGDKGINFMNNGGESFYMCLNGDSTFLQLGGTQGMVILPQGRGLEVMYDGERREVSDRRVIERIRMNISLALETIYQHVQQDFLPPVALQYYQRLQRNLTAFLIAQ